MTNEQLVALIRAGDDEANNMLQLWQQNKGFIYKLAKRYSGYAELEDLTQEGYLGLCEAVHQYDLDMGVPFINYAAFWIKQAMRRYIDNCSSVVRIPVHAKEDIREYQKVLKEYWKYYGHEPWIAVDQLPDNLPEVIRHRYIDGMTLKETGQRMGVGIERVRQIEAKAMRTLRSPRRCRTFRAYYEEYIEPCSYRHVGVRSFQNTWLSEVEREVLGW